MTMKGQWQQSMQGTTDYAPSSLPVLHQGTLQSRPEGSAYPRKVQHVSKSTGRFAVHFPYQACKNLLAIQAIQMGPEKPKF